MLCSAQRRHLLTERSPESLPTSKIHCSISSEEHLVCLYRIDQTSLGSILFGIGIPGAWRHSQRSSCGHKDRPDFVLKSCLQHPITDADEGIADAARAGPRFPLVWTSHAFVVQHESSSLCINLQTKSRSPASTLLNFAVAQAFVTPSRNFTASSNTCPLLNTCPSAPCSTETLPRTNFVFPQNCTRLNHHHHELAESYLLHA